MVRGWGSDHEFGIVAAMALAVLALTWPVRAQTDTTEPVRLTYMTSPECPTTTFSEQVFARARRARPAAPTEVARSFDAAVQVRAGKIEGHLVVHDVGGATSSRVIVGKTCVEVEAALALVTALIVDPEASTTPVTGLVLAPVPSVATPLSTTPPPPVVPRPTALPLIPPVVPRKPPNRWRVETGVAAAIRMGVASNVALGETTFVGIASPSKRLASPELRIGVTLAREVDITTPVGGARFSWAVARVDACPVRFGVDFTLRACALLEGGTLMAAGLNIMDAQSAARPWVAPGLAVHAALHVSSLLVEIEVAALVPLLRDTFTFGPANGPPTYIFPVLAPMLLAGSFGVVISR